MNTIKHTRHFSLNTLYFVLCTLYFSLWTQKAQAQQDPQFTQYMFNPLVLNPAYAGSRELTNLALVNRNQWVGIDGAPRTQTLSANSPLQNKKMGVGLHLINSKIGAYQTTGILGSYAYRIKAGTEGKLSFGLRVGVSNYSFDWNKLEYKNQSDYVNSAYSKNSVWVPTIDFGMYYYTKTLYAGLCISHLNKPAFTPTVTGNDTIKPKSSLIRNITFTLGNAFIINENITFRPSLLVHTAGFKTGFVDLNSAFLIREKFWVGLGYRTSRAMMFISEYYLPKGFRIGYSFELMFNRLQTVSKGSHEVFLGWDIAPTKKHVHSIRYF